MSDMQEGREIIGSYLAPYQEILGAWNKDWGSKPTVKLLREVNEKALALRGSKTAFALAMLMRQEGATQVQIKAALGATYRNRANQLCVMGMASMKRQGVNGQTRYRLELRKGTVKRPVVVDEVRVSA